VLNKLKPMLFGIVALLVFGCAEIEPRPFEPSAGHIKSDEKPAGQIPELVQKTPVLPAPQPPVELQKMGKIPLIRKFRRTRIDPI